LRRSCWRRSPGTRSAIQPPPGAPSSARSIWPNPTAGSCGSCCTQLRYLPTHLSAPEIADELSVATSTVKTHMRNLYTKLDGHSRADAVERARALGLLAPSARL
jgi:LuxR family transcriptional regulator, maltose regulon positive regulatory protein